MFDGIIELVIGIVLVIFLANYIAGANTGSLSSTDTMILVFVPTIALVLLLYGFIKSVRGSKFGM